MNNIKIVIEDKEINKLVPSCFDEMSQANFIQAAKIIMVQQQETPIPDEIYASILNIEQEVWLKLLPAEQYYIKKMLNFINIEQNITKQILQTIEVGDIKLIGYQPDFSNTTWEEFIYCDGYALAGKYREAAAVLYRPQRENYTGETDRRIPFSIYGTANRLELLKSVPDEIIIAFILNYRSLRKNYIEKKYTYIFPKYAAKLNKKTNDNTFSWVSVHRELMGEQFYDEDKFFHTQVNVMLNRMNSVIRENLRKKK